MRRVTLKAFLLGTVSRRAMVQYQDRVHFLGLMAKARAAEARARGEGGVK